MVENIHFGKPLLPYVLLYSPSIGKRNLSNKNKRLSFYFFAIRFLFRLYWYPMKVLYTAGVVTGYRAYDKGCGLYGFFNVLLWILLGLNIYWLVVRYSNNRISFLTLLFLLLVYSSISLSSVYWQFK